MLDPQAHTTRGVAIGTVLEGLKKAQSHANSKGLSTLLIVNFMRERDEEEALELLASLKPYRKQIVALGIDSAEIDHPPRKFTRLFKKARAMGLKLVAHAGFEGPPEDMEEAINLLQVDRADHANRVYERPELARRPGEAGTAVTVCPRAEVQLGVVAWLAEHPVGQIHGWDASFATFRQSGLVRLYHGELHRAHARVWVDAFGGSEARSQ
jgi:adenosine deaminase